MHLSLLTAQFSLKRISANTPALKSLSALSLSSSKVILTVVGKNQELESKPIHFSSTLQAYSANVLTKSVSQPELEDSPKPIHRAQKKGTSPGP
jgi:hypothetical protein